MKPLDIGDTAPTPHFLKSLRGDTPRYDLLLAEAIDNAFDAGASNVVATIGINCIEIHDDGRGVEPEKAAALVQIGGHIPHSSTALGRYGVGIKIQGLSCGNSFTVNSMSEKGKLRVSVRWDVMVRDGNWSAGREALFDENIRGATYTHVTIGHLVPLRRRADIEKIKAELAAMFYPALINGKSIEVNSVRLAAPPNPQMTDVINETVFVKEGKGAHILAGIPIESDSRGRFAHISYKHRVISPGKTSFGYGDLSGAGQDIFCRIDLIGEWRLSAFKEKFDADKDAEALEELVHDVLLPLLRKCEKAKKSDLLLEIERQLNDRLPPELRPSVRPRHKKEPKSAGGDKVDGGKNNPSDDNEDDDEGPAKSSKPRGGIKITFGKCEGLGKYVPGSGRSAARVILPDEHKDIKWLIHNKSPESRDLLFIIAGFLIYHESLSDDQLQLPFSDQDKCDEIGKLVAGLIQRQSMKLVEAAE